MSLTNIIKTALLHYYGFGKGMYCCTELSYSLGDADIFAIPKFNNDKPKSNELIEVEVKISKSDLMNEFKEDKHTKNNKYLTFESKNISFAMPNKFYICVPEDLVDYCKQQLDIHNRDYVGILMYKPRWANDNRGKWLKLDESISVVRKAKKIYKDVDNKTYFYFLFAMINRLRNDNLGFHKERYFDTNRYKPIRAIVE